ncbi:hypothetical protein KAR91_23720 [Candidatus Pacearchaeota archaeon]|nr:hypothetical protein [Candidatus Pacearchaeota archaeon]
MKPEILKAITDGKWIRPNSSWDWFSLTGDTFFNGGNCLVQFPWHLVGYDKWEIKVEKPPAPQTGKEYSKSISTEGINVMNWTQISEAFDAGKKVGQQSADPLEYKYTVPSTALAYHCLDKFDVPRTPARVVTMKKMISEIISLSRELK